MQILSDLMTSVYNFRETGKVLSKRSNGMVVGFVVLLVILYVTVFSIWYSTIFGDFVEAAINVAEPDMPTFSIIGGQLKMQSEEPYIITHEDIYRVMISSMLEVDKKRFGGKQAKQLESAFNLPEIKTKDSFCFVMDTTDTYKDKIDLSNFTNYIVINKDSMEQVDRVQKMPGNITPLSETVQQDIQFQPGIVSRIIPTVKRFATILIAIGLFIYTPIHFLVKALIAAFLVWLVLMIARKSNPFGLVYKISLYSLTPVVLLAIISSIWFPIHGLILQAVYFGYIIMAVLAMAKSGESPLKETAKNK